MMAKIKGIIKDDKDALQNPGIKNCTHYFNKGKLFAFTVKNISKIIK